MNLQKFTEKAQQAILATADLAREFGHASVEPEHLLVVLVEQEGGVVPSVLRKLGQDPTAVARELREWLGRQPSMTGGGAEPHLSPRLRVVVDSATADALTRMVYGIVCFATLFSLIGTVLGGIWADQSWGRFWGWDPKENGALIIVIWNAVILHARWGGLVKQRGLMALAIFGNIVTSWSWFGVNMLGVGLHSYGFMDAAFYWLIAFVASQVAIIALSQLPLAKWRSFRETTVPAS